VSASTVAQPTVNLYELSPLSHPLIKDDSRPQLIYNSSLVSTYPKNSSSLVSQDKKQFYSLNPNLDFMSKLYSEDKK